MSQYNASNVESMTPRSFNPYDQRNYFLMTSGMATRRMMWETENPYSRGNRNAFKKVRGAGTDNYSRMLSEGYTGPNSSLGGTPGVSLGRNYNAKSQGPVEVKQLNKMLGRVSGAAASGLGYVADYANDFSNIKKYNNYQAAQTAAATAQAAAGEASWLAGAPARAASRQDRNQTYLDTVGSQPHGMPTIGGPGSRPLPSLDEGVQQRTAERVAQQQAAGADRNKQRAAAAAAQRQQQKDQEIDAKVEAWKAGDPTATTAVKDEAGNVVTPRSRTRRPRKQGM